MFATSRHAIVEPYAGGQEVHTALLARGLRRLGHHVWDRLVDPWERLEALPPIAPVASWPTSDPSFSASAMYGFSLGASSADSDGMLSALVTPPVTR